MSNSELVRQAEEQLKALKQTLKALENKPDSIPVELTTVFQVMDNLVWEINDAISWHNFDASEADEVVLIKW